MKYLLLSLSLALRNLSRHRGRTLSTLTAMAVGLTGLAFLDGYVNYSLWGLGETIVHSGTGHLQVAASPAYFDEGDSDPFPFLLDDSRALAKRLRRMPEVHAVVPSLAFTGVVASETTMETVRVQAFPTALRKENLGFLTLNEGRDLEEGEAGAILLGQGLATKLGAVPGSTLTLHALTAGGGMANQSYHVVGLVTSGIAAADAVAVFLDLGDAQALIGTDQVPLLTVFLEQTKDTASVVAQLTTRTDLEVRGWQSLSPYFRQAETSYLMIRGVAGFIVLIVALFSISGTLNLSVLERLRELGTLRAFGTRRGQVVLLLSAEGLVLGLVGALVGTVAGWGLTSLLNASGGLTMAAQPGMSAPLTILFRPDPGRFLANGLWVTAAALAGSWFPSHLATRKLIAELLRSE